MPNPTAGQAAANEVRGTAITMNLSQRLDHARAKRDDGIVPDRGPTPFDLRMSRDAPVYDGRHLRTGEAMTSDRWEELQSEPGDEGLPTWKPSRANDLVTIDLRIDVHADDHPDLGGDVIDLRDHRPTRADTFEMPAWAGGTQVFQSELE